LEQRFKRKIRTKNVIETVYKRDRTQKYHVKIYEELRMLFNDLILLKVKKISYGRVFNFHCYSFNFRILKMYGKIKNVFGNTFLIFSI